MGERARSSPSCSSTEVEVAEEVGGTVVVAGQSKATDWEADRPKAWMREEDMRRA